MYLKFIHNVNVGPIEDAKITFPFNENNKLPKPVVVVGENGTGKSVLLSNIVDSFYLIANAAFDNAMKTDDVSARQQFYKIITGQEIRSNEKYMYSYIQYQDKNIDETSIEYLFKSGDLSTEDFCRFENVSHQKFSWNDETNYKDVKFDEKKAESIFNNNVICYFPPSRYEKPNWLGDKYYNSEEYMHPSVKENFSRRLDKPLTIVDVTKNTLQWLLDVIADSRCDVESTEIAKWNLIHCDPKTLRQMGTVRKNLEKIMGEILGKNIYFGLNYRSFGRSRFNVNDALDGRSLIPSLNALSTGQSALFNIFATIIRYADNNFILSGAELENIAGIVVIDEVELHLHSNLQRDVLPKLLKLFPKVQFIISSHSPLFLLGMDKIYGSDGYEIYEMPSARIINAERFSEFGKAYEYFTDTATHHQKIREVIQQHKKNPLIITEGSTDWKHLKAAFENLKVKPEYASYSSLNFEFLEYEPSETESKINGIEKCVYLKMGKDALKQMCQEHAKLKQSRKIIFIADRDDKKIAKELQDEHFPFRDWGNNIFSFVLPVPEHRKSTPEICIEHYYTDSEIKTPVEINGIPRRLYMGNEFDDSGIGINEDIQCKDLNSCGKNKINILDGCDNKPVYILRDQAKKNLALPKMKFAEGILNQSAEFASFNFDSFHLIFDIINQILDKPDV